MGAESTDEEVTRSLSVFKWPAQRVALWAETFNERRAALVEISSQKNQNSFAEGLVSLSLLDKKTCSGWFYGLAAFRYLKKKKKKKKKKLVFCRLLLKRQRGHR